MKKLLSILSILICANSFATHITLPLSGTGIYISNSSAYASYDTLFVDSSLRPNGIYTSFYMDSLFGTPTHRIYIVNIGKVTFSQSSQSKFKLENGRYITVTSALVNQDNMDGFTFTSPVGTRGGVGFEITLRSKAVTFQYITSTNNGYCSWAKNELSCDSTLGNWILDSIWCLHSTFLNNGQKIGTADGTGQNYWGSTSPNALDLARYIMCGSTKVYGHIPAPLPSLLANARFQFNKVIGTGRGGIYLNSAAYGQSYITDNIFDSIGFNGESGQGSAIAAGGFSSVTIARNSIGRTLETAVFCAGANLDSLYNNSSISCGHLNGFTKLNQPTWFIDTRPIPRIPNDSLRIYLVSNISGTNTDVAIRVLNSYNGYYATGNLICSNTKQDGSAADTSIISSFHYTTSCSVPVDTLPNTPVAIPSSGTILPTQTVTLCCAPAGVTIYYTLDGTNPRTSGTRITYTVPFIVSSTIGATVQLKAVAENSVGFSSVDKEDYEITGGASLELTQVDFINKKVTVYFSDGSIYVTDKPVKKVFEFLKKKTNYVQIFFEDGSVIIKP